MNTKAVFFDLYQTLINVGASKKKTDVKTGFEAIIVPYLRQRGVSESDAALVLLYYTDEVKIFYNNYDIKQYHHNFSTILSTIFKKYYRIIISEAEMGNLLYEFRKINRGYLKIYDGISEMLEVLSANFTLFVASHTQGIYTERELEELGIKKYFSHRIYSSDIGYKKTSNNFYQKCLEVANRKPYNCVMVGDNLFEDVYMANQNGIHTVWIINPLTKDESRAEIVPDARLPIESIRNLPSIIAKVLDAPYQRKR